MNKIIININEANKAQKYKEKEELFQIEAFRKVTEILQKHSLGKNTNNITDCRYHGTIFIDGSRGVGKTAFMLNIDNYYNEIDREEKQKFIFLDPVDPTLLEHTEKFLSVVLARIVERVKVHVDNFNTNIEMKDYYEALEKLSKSLSAIKTLDDDLGIEEIASSKSSLKLEQHAHNFFSIVCKLFGSDIKALVMLIDDVDMAFNKGFDVLEVVRKYLASPFIIPVVAGDIRLYREIVETEFMDKVKFNNDINHLSKIYKDAEELKNSPEYNKKKNLLNNLVEQYLRKVFPNDSHIKLKEIFTILKENRVEVKVDETISIPYTEIKDFEIRHINLGINQTEFTYQVFSNNTRDLMQYLYSKKDMYKEVFASIDYPKALEYKKYIPINVIDKYDDVIKNMIFKKSHLYKKSLEITSQIYEYSDKKQKELSLLTYNDAHAYKNNNYNIYNAFLGKAFENSKLNREEVNNDYSVEYQNYKEISSSLNDTEKFALDLFVYNDYYTQYKTKNFIFSGKFIEMMIYSLSIDNELNIDSDISKKLNDKLSKVNYETIIKKEHIAIFNGLSTQKNNNDSDFNDISKYFNEIEINTNFLELSEITNKVPFNSVFNENSRYDNYDNDEENNDNVDCIFEYETTQTGNLLLIWKNVFCKDIKINSLSLYEILNKFFNNLNTLKDSSRIKTPLEFMQRIIMIFINSIAYFENTNMRIANTNIAIGKDFEFINTLQKDNAATKNIKPMLSVNNSLTKAMFFHPVIIYILFQHKDSRISELNFVKNNQYTSDNKKFNALTKDIGRYTDKKIINLLEKLETFTTNELKQLSKNSIYNNKLMKNSINKKIIELQNKIRAKIR